MEEDRPLSRRTYLSAVVRSEDRDWEPLVRPLEEAFVL